MNRNYRRHEIRNFYGNVKQIKRDTEQKEFMSKIKNKHFESLLNEDMEEEEIGNLITLKFQHQRASQVQKHDTEKRSDKTDERNQKRNQKTKRYMELGTSQQFDQYIIRQQTEIAIEEYYLWKLHMKYAYQNKIGNTNFESFRKISRKNQKNQVNDKNFHSRVNSIQISLRLSKEEYHS